MPETVHMDGMRFGEVRFRFSRDLWNSVVEWCDANGVKFRDCSTMLYTTISLSPDDAVLFRARWEGVSQ